jgi:hypothetical protein
MEAINNKTFFLTVLQSCRYIHTLYVCIFVLWAILETGVPHVRASSFVSGLDKTALPATGY